MNKIISNAELVAKLLEEIAAGEMDEYSKVIADAYQRRAKVANAVKLGDLQPGDKVQFNDKVRPRYMKGQLATVKSVNQTTVTITLDAGETGRFSGGAMRCPVSLVDKV